MYNSKKKNPELPWQSIETAPKDRYILLLWPLDENQSVMMSVGCWDADQYATKPKPYWSGECDGWLGKRYLRLTPPTHWLEIYEVDSENK